MSDTKRKNSAQKGLRVLAGILCLVMLLLAATGCTDTDTAGTAHSGEHTSSGTQSVSGNTHTTLMIYMVGSDLEAKSAAGTTDLEEIRASGVDLSRHNVVICTGGTRKWHNDVTTAETLNYLQLTQEGYVTLETKPSASMGESASLADFLNYSYTNFTAEHYALILWDHGNGPVIGYGKDMLYDNDTLTLGEMQQALQDSPFGGENKLEWVGFDACLMASAELTEIWAEYADYLVASQEIEPSFGWDYAFLKDLGAEDTAAFLTQLTQIYLEACQAYYDKKGYENRDTTLSCLDLRQAEELTAALEALFTRAAGDVTEHYSVLTAKRAQTRALGRASTGSEYDLIDLKDMAQQLSELYPEETARLTAAVDAMVVSNATNAQGCCGMSLYYPFYNKTYFEKDWQAVYQQLGLFPAYLQYLESYAEIWLGNDMLEFAQSTTPNAIRQGVYSLELTDEQAENFAHAKYYILQRDGEELYLPLYSSSTVTQTGNTLTASFDGNIIYVKSKFGVCGIPSITEYDTVGEITHYGVYVNLSNEMSYLVDPPEDFEEKIEGYRFHLTLDHATGEISVGALVPWDDEVTTEELLGGKLEDADLTDWSVMYFALGGDRYLNRYENGTIMPVSQWPGSGVYTHWQFPVGDDVSFEYAPLEAGEYYIIFEITDTQGSSYCSEPLPITATGEVPQPIYPEEITVEWDSGENVLLCQESNLTVWLTHVETYEGKEYTLQVRNDNDYPVVVYVNDIFLNGNIYAQDADGCSFVIAANSTRSYKYGIDLGGTADLALEDGITSLSFSILARHAYKLTTLIFAQPIQVALGEAVRLEVPKTHVSFELPINGMLAEEQLIYNADGLEATLLGIGTNDLGDWYWGDRRWLEGCVRWTNTTDEPIYVHIEALAIDGVYLSMTNATLLVPAGCVVYERLQYSPDSLERNMVTSGAEVQLLICFSEFITLEGGGGGGEMVWCDVTLSQSGQPVPFQEGETVLFDEQGVRVALKCYETFYGYPCWYLTIINESDIPLALALTDCSINGIYVGDEYYGQEIFDAKVGAGQKTVGGIVALVGVDVESLSFRLRILDFNQEKILYDGAEIITLYPDNP